MTQNEFACKYGIHRVDVNAAVKQSGLESDKIVKRIAGRHPKDYAERDLARAVKDYYLILRDNHMQHAQHWQKMAAGIVKVYKEGKQDG